MAAYLKLTLTTRFSVYVTTRQGFASGVVNLGEIEVFTVTRFEFIWSSVILDPKKPVIFYKPVEIPNRFHILGHYCQPSDKPLWGYVLVAKETGTRLPETNEEKSHLRNPLDFKLVWSSNAPGNLKISSGCGYFWLPEPPKGYKVVGYFVTEKPDKLELDEMCCVRADLTDKCEPYCEIFVVGSRIPGVSFQVRSSRPCDRGMLGKGEIIETAGSNLPHGGSNYGEFWIDLPSHDDIRDFLKHTDLKSAKLYVHVKPALGGTFTHIAMWIFAPFNGPATLKIGIKNIHLSKIDEHVGDWEHYTLRNKAIVYSSKSEPASYPHPGTYIQGSSKQGLGIRKTKLFVFMRKWGPKIVYDSKTELDKLMRKWGPKIVYDSKTELDKILNQLPCMLHHSMRNLFNMFPVELYGEYGPTGPKGKTIG
ncbi:hypothetical protein TSUD_60860 [Trifolium subterraneum]|uniref:Uncharacterized protein n=1 Tax=Trifolium subterraneum TaxID=3900 RepID=A0A2Z6NTX1_TRISU|nr:hypothetical protein TSUD_60860 [Trifolium subterraneum]